MRAALPCVHRRYACRSTTRAAPPRAPPTHASVDQSCQGFARAAQINHTGAMTGGYLDSYCSNSVGAQVRAAPASPRPRARNAPAACGLARDTQRSRCLARLYHPAALNEAQRSVWSRRMRTRALSVGALLRPTARRVPSAAQVVASAEMDAIDVPVVAGGGSGKRSPNAQQAAGAQTQREQLATAQVTKGTYSTSTLTPRDMRLQHLDVPFKNLLKARDAATTRELAPAESDEMSLQQQLNEVLTTSPPFIHQRNPLQRYRLVCRARRRLL
jgi:hypothetical protein